MSWDLAISEHGDVVLTGHRDLGGKSGTDLIEQRMTIRLKLMRGSWIYDDAGTLGSHLHNLIGVAPERAAPIVPAYVREALRDIDEITLQDVQVSYDEKNLVILIFYRVSEINSDEAAREFQVTLPLAGGGV